MTVRWGRTLAPLLVASCAALAQSPSSPDGSREREWLASLPLVELPATRAGGHTLVLLISGDGNWASAMRSVAGTLADSGYAVIGLEARSYMSQERTPDGTAQDAARILRHYLTQWGRDSIVIAGFSRGAGWAPIIAARLPADLAARVRLVAMLSPGLAANYEFVWSDLLFDIPRDSDIALLPFVNALPGRVVLCVYGVDDASRSICPGLRSSGATVVERRGGHRPVVDEHLSEPILKALGGADRGARTRAPSSSIGFG